MYFISLPRDGKVDGVSPFITAGWRNVTPPNGKGVEDFDQIRERARVKAPSLRRLLLVPGYILVVPFLQRQVSPACRRLDDEAAVRSP